MKNQFPRFFFLIYLFFVTANIALSQWTHIGKPDISQIISIKKSGDSLYCMTYSGLYFKNIKSEEWKLIDATKKYPMVNDGFAIDKGNIYLYNIMSHSENTVFSLHKSSDFGKSWKNIYSYQIYSGVAQVNIKNDTILIGLSRGLIYSFNGGKSFDNLTFFGQPFGSINLTPVNDTLYFSAQNIIKVFDLKTFDRASYLDFNNLKDVVTIPDSVRMVQMIVSGKEIWILASIDLRIILYRFSISENKLEAVYTSRYKKQNFVDFSKLGKNGHKIYLYKNDDIDRRMVFTEDGGRTFKESQSLINGFSEFIDNSVFSEGYKLYKSDDLGLNYSDDTKGLFSPNYLEFAAYPDGLFLKSIRRNSITYSYKLNEEPNFYWKQTVVLNDLVWVQNGRKQTALIKSDSLFLGNADASNFQYVPEVKVNYRTLLAYVNGSIWVLGNDIAYRLDDNAVHWKMLQIQGSYNAKSLTYNDGKYCIINDEKAWISDDGENFNEVKVNKLFSEGRIFNGFYQNGILYLYNTWSSVLVNAVISNQSTFNSRIISNIPDIFNANSRLIPLGGRLICGSNSYDGIYISNSEGKDWISINDNLDNKTIFSLAIYKNYLYCLNTTGIWRRPLDDILKLYSEANSDTIDDFTMSPVPVTDVLNVVLPEAGKYKEAKIYDNSGNIIMKPAFISEQTNFIDVSMLKAGIYFLQFKVSERSITKKFVKI